MDISVLVVDDHPMFRMGVRTLLNGRAGIQVVGECERVEMLDWLITQLKPDVVLMDVNMPGMDGCEATRRLVDGDFAGKVVGCSVHSSVFHAQSMLDAGAVGYVSKERAPDEIVRAIHTAMEGGVYVSELADGSCLRDTPIALSGLRVKRSLTHREREVFAAYLRGMGPKEVSGRLSLTQNTIKTYLRRIKAKIGEDRWRRVQALRTQRLKGF